jgi:hypothetical protein
LAGLDELTGPQRQMVTGLIRLGLHQAADLLDDPGRPPGWTFTDPAILQGWGRGSAVVPGALAAAVPELAGVRSFLDVGSVSGCSPSPLRASGRRRRSSASMYGGPRSKRPRPTSGRPGSATG